MTPNPRGVPLTRRRVLAAILLLVALALLGVILVRPHLERRVRARIEHQSARRGLTTTVQTVRIGIWPPVVLEGVRVEKPGGWAAYVESLALSLRARGTGLAGRTRVALGQVTFRGPAGLSGDTEPARWDVDALADGGWGVRLVDPSAALAVTWRPATGGGRLEVRAKDAPLGRLIALRRDGLPLVDGGVTSGTAWITSASEVRQFTLDLEGRQVRLPTLSAEGSNGGGPGLGEPTELTLRCDGSWRPAGGALDLPRWKAAVPGATLAGSMAVADLRGAPRIDLTLEVERVDFAQLFRTSGLAPEFEVVPLAPGAGKGELGSASLSARIQGRLDDPRSFEVTQRLDFRPPARTPRAIEVLRRAFVHRVARPGGGSRAIDVSPASPDFIAYAEVPPLFVLTLLLGEDAGFFGHRGVDLSELPAAVLTNWKRGGSVRGASTITQQLAKNLFLTREKRLSRKLQELSLALLLEATLGKERILEIYLNVIEWGPGLHGLRPAARRYFHAEPAELSPRQMAFLVALIPGPIKYQRSFASGTLSPGFRPLVDDLLAKLRSIDALTDEDYQSALAEELRVETADPTEGEPVP